MAAIVECVPNFSEGRDPAIISQITDAIQAVEGVALLDVDPGNATNRTVVTFVGSPDAVVEAAFQGIAKAAEVIDMSRHSGAHPRMGATDVCPFVPVSGISMEECAALARKLGARVGKELDIPVYLYEDAASRPERRNLAAVREGEYEALPKKLQSPEWLPDFGPAKHNARSGATVIGARPFLIAFNVNLNTKEKRKAMKLAAMIREKGMLQKDAEGNILRDDEGNGIRKPGLFKCVKGIGWYIPEYERAQLSFNFTNYNVASLHDVVDTVRRLADDEGVVVTGCELVGLVPLDALEQAGRHYLSRQGLNPGVPVDELVEVAIQSLGLRDLGPFDPQERVIDFRIASDGPLVQKTIRDFVDTTSSSAPAPGGGSVAALCGSLSAALSAMVGSLTSGKKGYESHWLACNEMAVRAQALKDAYLADIDADTAAFDGIMTAMALPKKTPEDKHARRSAMRAATIEAIEVPLRVLERTIPTLNCVDVALDGNRNARSDAGVAALVARACAEGAYYNVLINLEGFADKDYAKAALGRADAALREVMGRTEATTQLVRQQLVDSIS